MPLYEYRCTACAQVVEVIQRFSDKPRTRCESCGGKLEKLVSRTGFILKGGGWYASGYSKGSGEAGAAAGGESAAKAEPAAAGDAKPAAKPEAPAPKKAGKGAKSGA